MYYKYTGALRCKMTFNNKLTSSVLKSWETKFRSASVHKG